MCFDDVCVVKVKCCCLCGDDGECGDGECVRFVCVFGYVCVVVGIVGVVCVGGEGLCV